MYSDKPTVCRDCKSYRETPIYDPPRYPSYNCVRWKILTAPGSKACVKGTKVALPKTDQPGLF